MHEIDVGPAAALAPEPGPRPRRLLLLVAAVPWLILTLWLLRGTPDDTVAEAAPSMLGDDATGTDSDVSGTGSQPGGWPADTGPARVPGGEPVDLSTPTTTDPTPAGWAEVDLSALVAARTLLGSGPGERFVLDAVVTGRRPLSDALVLVGVRASVLRAEAGAWVGPGIADAAIPVALGPPVATAGPGWRSPTGDTPTSPPPGRPAQIDSAAVTTALAAVGLAPVVGLAVDVPTDGVLRARGSGPDGDFEVWLSSEGPRVLEVTS